MLSDVPGAMEGLGTEHGVSARMQDRWDAAKLSNTIVPEDSLSSSLVYWRSPQSPYQLVRFGDMAEFGVPQVHLWLMHCVVHLDYNAGLHICVCSAAASEQLLISVLHSMLNIEGTYRARLWSLDVVSTTQWGVFFV